MAKRNYLVERVSGTGKSSVCDELQRRGYRAINGDRELAYQGDAETGKRTEAYGHEYHIWDVDKVREIAAKKEDELLFFCGGFRNFDKVIDLFDKVFVLDLDTETLKQRLDSRTADDWGGNKKERELILRLHATKQDIPDGMIIDAARPLNEVVDAIVECIEVSSTVTHGPKPKHMSRLMRGRLL
jgi:shikimate kinase